MSDQNLGLRTGNVIKTFHSDEVTSSGHVYLFRWLADRWHEDAAKHVIGQFLLFYVFILIGFVFLYFMFLSTSHMRANIRDIRRNVVDALSAQRERKWDEDDYSKTTSVGFM